MDEMVLTVQTWLNDTYSGVSGFSSVTEDGITGQGTISALIKALQIELGISDVDGVFGDATYSAFTTLSTSSGSSYKNQIYILQGALYCKGYNPNGLDGGFGNGVNSAVINFKTDAGLSNPSGAVTSQIMKALLTMDAFKLLTYGDYDGDSNIRTIQQNLNRDYSSNSAFAKKLGLVPCDGIYSSKTNKALLYAMQIQEGLSTVDGIWGNQTKNAAATLSYGVSNKPFVLLLQYLLYCNGYDSNGFDGIFGNGVKAKVIAFQSFCSLTADGVVGGQTWASLLVSTGDPSRQGTFCDCATTITSETAKTIASNGYTAVGRYLAGKYAMTSSEIQIIFDNGLNIVPIYEVGGYYAGWFTENHGKNDALAAIIAAKCFGFKSGTTIYFTVDYDASDADITNRILPYFKQIKQIFDNNNSPYKIGIYAPRYVCTCVYNSGYATTSFVCDMSTGFAGNIGHTLPVNWAFDQIATKTIGSDTAAIEIDNNIASGKDSGQSSVNSIDISDIQLTQLNNNVLSKIFDITFSKSIETEIVLVSTGNMTIKAKSKLSAKGEVGDGDFKIKVSDGKLSINGVSSDSVSLSDIFDKYDIKLTDKFEAELSAKLIEAGDSTLKGTVAAGIDKTTLTLESSISKTYNNITVETTVDVIIEISDDFTDADLEEATESASDLSAVWITLGAVVVVAAGIFFLPEEAATGLAAAATCFVVGIWNKLFGSDDDTEA